MSSAAHKPIDVRERGVALLSALVALVLIGTAAWDFAYNTHVDLTSAVNARDDLRAHYLARSGVNLARLLLKVQERVIEPNKKLLGGMDLQIADYAPMLMSAFNSKEGAEMLGSLLGVEAGTIKGIGVDVGNFDLQMDSLDGKLNLNCGGGTNAGSPSVTRLAASLAAMMLPRRYDRLFEEPDDKGEYTTRVDQMRAIIDWADQDTVLFGASGAAEDYRYNGGPDPYEIKNHYYDTVEEIRLVKGVDDDFMAAFGNAFTVYGGCQVNVNLAPLPVLTALLVQHAATPTDPALRWENLAVVARLLKVVRGFYGGFPDMKSFIQAAEQPAVAAAMVFSGGGVDGEEVMGNVPLPSVQGIKLNGKTLKEGIVVGGTRRIWRLRATATVGKVKKMITAVWDTKYISFQARKQNTGAGGFMYWREE